MLEQYNSLRIPSACCPAPTIDQANPTKRVEFIFSPEILYFGNFAALGKIPLIDGRDPKITLRLSFCKK